MRQGDNLHVLTTNNVHEVNININCSTYHTCIDCASDPDCMWEKKNNKCIDYNVDSYRLHLYAK